ncbi:hypothetical protein HD806DRAFT_540032 [Xylariaceae sp. AK1471]|nr:hypothetical protein HD806DRAFT_540032 [Xylariaceae sp. AK1471]
MTLSRGPSGSTSQTSRRRSQSVERQSNYRSLPRTSPIKAAGIHVPKPLPWPAGPSHTQISIDDEAVNQFMDKFVMHPYNETSSPGFLEHLPSMYQEVNVEGRFALRWAVGAAALADLSRSQNSDQLAQKALHCYGMSLQALGQSLAEPGKAPDDYDLMTMVMLDIFETFHNLDNARKGMHAQGMAQILRLRSYDEQVYNPRGWSLFRLAHHRIQKQQLMVQSQLIPLQKSKEWINQLNDDLPFVHLEKNALEITEICRRARNLRQSLEAGDSSVAHMLKIVNELLELDCQVVSWRQSPKWAYTIIKVAELPPFDPSVKPLTDTIELHSDLWMIYEWNYHRTARIVAHEHLLKCITAALASPEIDLSGTETLKTVFQQSVDTIYTLAEEILATVPQSFGDVDHLGRLHDYQSGPPLCRGIGGYLLLWPIKMIGGTQVSTAEDQKRRGQVVFERIREYTGMKSHLGHASKIIQ